jgi:hypothetical protein
MKSRAFILVAAIVTLPGLAQEQRAQSLPAQVQDSPLVAAAKRSKRLGQKPAMVITNEMLASSGASAHVTTTKSQAPLSANRISTPVETRAVPEKRGDASNAKLEKTDPTVPRHDDAEAILEEGGRGDLVVCRSCLPILEPGSKTLRMSKAEPSTNPPRVETPKPPQTEPPRPPSSKNP